MNELALFAGAGGGILGGLLSGFNTICAVEKNPFARDVLVARQNDRCLAPFPIWDDVCTFNGKPWRGIIDVVSGGFPCQDISAAGKGAGISGERSGLWREMARIIGEVQPRYVFVENSPLLVRRGLGLVLGDLAAMGYDSRWGIVGAHHAGAPHKRHRIWIVADAKSIDRRLPVCAGDEEQGDEPFGCREGMGYATGSGLPHGLNRSVGRPEPHAQSERSDWWSTEPDVGRVAHGVATRVDRLRCLGNGQVPAVVKLAWDTLMKKNEL